MHHTLSFFSFPIPYIIIISYGLGEKVALQATSRTRVRGVAWGLTELWTIPCDIHKMKILVFLIDSI